MSGNGRSNRVEQREKQEFAIQSGIPVPAKRGGSTYPWAEMLDGDSIFVACGDGEQRQMQRRVYVNGRQWLKKNRPKAKIVTRVESKGVRVWLLEA